MNVLFVIPTMKRGGAEKMVAYLANYFCLQKESEVSILVYDNEYSAFPLSNKIKYIKLDCKPIELKTRLPIINKIRRIIVEENIDTVVGFSIGVSEIIPFASYGLACRTIGSERSNPYLKQHSSLRRNWQNHVLFKLDGMIFTTNGCRDYYSKKIGMKSAVIPNGYFERKDREAFDPNIREKSKQIIAVGNLRKVKDYPTMLEGFKIFSYNHSDYILNIYGEGIEEKPILSQIQKMGLSDRVTLHGSVDNLDIVYRDCSFLIHSSISESWCNAILEAQSYGVPCIAADCDFGPREMIRDGLNGYLYEVGNGHQLAICMSNIVDKEGKLREMSIYAYNDVKRFEFSSIADKYYAYISGISIT